MTGSTRLSIRWFDTFAEATEFSIKLPPYSVLEIKKYDNKTNNTKNNSNING